MVYVEEKVRKFAFKGIKDVEKNIFDKSACQTLNSVSRMIN